MSIIRATRDFEHALSQWSEKPNAEKNCSTFKTHFHEAQLQLKDMRGLTMQQAGNHHANSIAQQTNSNIQQQLTQRNSQILEMMQSMPVLAESSSQSDDSHEDHDYKFSSNSSQDNTQLQILRLLQDM